jgi:ATP-dependent HslUV protease subunit HslV
MTTILCVRRDGSVAMAGDGQVTLDKVVMKEGSRKVRTLRDGSVLVGFAGGAADALSLFTRFEAKLDEYHGNLERASVELVLEWRTDRALRRLEALLAVADARKTLLLGGTGDLIEPDDGILAIGSGGSCALAAARALIKHTKLNAADVARESLGIAAGIDIYTNDRVVVEVIGG